MSKQSQVEQNHKQATREFERQPVPQSALLGFKRFIIPKGTGEVFKNDSDVKILPVAAIREAVDSALV